MGLDYELKAKMIERVEQLAGADNKPLILMLANGSRLVGRSLEVIVR